MKRGDLVTIAVSGDYGKPRPALVIQADVFHDIGSVTVLRLTSDIHDWPAFRVTVEPHPSNGLRITSQIMIDKAVTVPLARVGQSIGRLDSGTMRHVSRALVAFLDLEEAMA